MPGDVNRIVRLSNKSNSIERLMFDWRTNGIEYQSNSRNAVNFNWFQLSSIGVRFSLINESIETSQNFPIKFHIYTFPVIQRFYAHASITFSNWRLAGEQLNVQSIDCLFPYYVFTWKTHDLCSARSCLPASCRWLSVRALHFLNYGKGVLQKNFNINYV